MKCRLPWCNDFVVIKRYYDLLFFGEPIPCLNLGSRHILTEVPEVFPTFFAKSKRTRASQIGAQSQRATWFLRRLNTDFVPAVTNAIQFMHKDYKNRHGVDTAIILFA